MNKAAVEIFDSIFFSVIKPLNSLHAGSVPPAAKNRQASSHNSHTAISKFCRYLAVQNPDNLKKFLPLLDATAAVSLYQGDKIYLQANLEGNINNSVIRSFETAEKTVLNSSATKLTGHLLL